MALQQGIAREISASYVGKTLQVLVERPAGRNEEEAAQVSSWEHGTLRSGATELAGRGRHLIARAEADAPDIDGRVLVRGKAEPGAFANVRIVGHTDYDLLGQAV